MKRRVRPDPKRPGRPGRPYRAEKPGRPGPRESLLRPPPPRASTRQPAAQEVVTDEHPTSEAQAAAPVHVPPSTFLTELDSHRRWLSQLSRRATLGRRCRSAARPVSWIFQTGARARSGLSRSSISSAASACTTITLTLCATMSWSSRAMRARSDATAASARSSRSRSARSARSLSSATYSRRVVITRWLPVRQSVGGWFDPRCLDPCVREGARIRFGLYLVRRPRKDSP